jgi:hypothetical protein
MKNMRELGWFPDSKPAPPPLRPQDEKWEMAFRWAWRLKSRELSGNNDWKAIMLLLVDCLACIWELERQLRLL